MEHEMKGTLTYKITMSKTDYEKLNQQMQIQKENGTFLSNGVEKFIWGWVTDMQFAGIEQVKTELLNIFNEKELLFLQKLVDLRNKKEFVNEWEIKITII